MKSDHTPESRVARSIDSFEMREHFDGVSSDGKLIYET